MFSQRQKGTMLPSQLKSLLRTRMGLSVRSKQNELSIMYSTANLPLLMDLKACIIRQSERTLSPQGWRELESRGGSFHTSSKSRGLLTTDALVMWVFPSSPLQDSSWKLCLGPKVTPECLGCEVRLCTV